jgi:putative addiction module antidote
MFSVRIEAVGSSVAIILPNEVLARLNVKAGDLVLLIEAADGSFRLMTSDADFDRQISLAADLMDEDREVLGPLAR